MPSAVDYGLQLYFIVTKIVTSLLSGAVLDGSHESLRGRSSLESVGRPVGRCPRLHAAPSGPHNPPPSPTRGHRFERVNGRHSLRMYAPRRVGLPYGSYPRLILAYLTTEAVRTKNPEIHLGATPNDLARKLGLSTISGPRGTAQRLEDQLRRLLSMRLQWKTSLGLHPTTSGSSFVGARRPALSEPCPRALPRTVRMASRDRLGSELLRTDSALCRTDRPSSDSQSQIIALRHRPVHLAHLPDELSEETHAGSVGWPAGSIRSRLLQAARLQTQSFGPSGRCCQGIPNSPGRSDKHRSGSLPFSATYSSPKLAESRDSEKA